MLALCHNDVVIDTLRGVFHANIVAIPESRIEPLVILAAGKNQASFRGAIQPLLKTPTTFTKPQVMQSTVPTISGTRTRDINLNSGLQILGNFLKGFGIPSIDLGASFEGATKVSFTFNKVQRLFVDINELGEAAVGSTLDRNNPAAAIFFEDGNKYSCYILDSAITSSEVTINVEKTAKTSPRLDVPTLSSIVAKANAAMTVSKSSNTSITFQGDKQLGFAFSCVHATFDNTGKFVSMEPGGQIPQLESLQDASPNRMVAHTPDHVLLSRDPAMLAVDFYDSAKAPAVETAAIARS